MKTFKILAVLLPAMISPALSVAQNAINDAGVSGVIYFSYEHYFDNHQPSNEFLLKRSYITFKKAISPAVNIRFTQDVSVDREGDGEGNIELRVKYALVNIALPNWGFIHNPNVEVGVVHRPWIDFEQDINRFRSQEVMLLDKHKITSSADYGVMIAGQLGGELPESASKNLRSNPGYYGSFSFGVYNGGGYSALEKNSNKVVEGRLSLRPFPEVIPGFQANFIGATGKGNIPEMPDFHLGALALSYESAKLTGVLQGFLSEGDTDGGFIYPNFEAMSLNGWSAFTEINPFSLPVSLTLRYDELNNADFNELISRKALIGLAYIFKNESKIILDVDRRWIGNTSFNTYEIVTEIQF